MEDTVENICRHDYIISSTIFQKLTLDEYCNISEMTCSPS